MRRLIEFASEFDGSEQKAIFTAPDEAGIERLPLVIIPHAAGWTAEATAGYWRDLPIRRGVMAVFPFGHSRKVELRSSGWRGQISDLGSLPRLITEMGYPVDPERIYATGISMGGMESLLLAGQHPGLLAGVVSFNAVCDLAAWYYDHPPTAPGVLEEVGGTPEEVPEEYAKRNPIYYAEAIAHTPVLIYWDPNDNIVPFQTEKHSGLLYRRVKETDPDAPIWGETHSKGHTWINPRLALDWLLARSRDIG